MTEPLLSPQAMQRLRGIALELATELDPKATARDVEDMATILAETVGAVAQQALAVVTPVLDALQPVVDAARAHIDHDEKLANAFVSYDAVRAGLPQVAT